MQKNGWRVVPWLLTVVAVVGAIWLTSDRSTELEEALRASQAKDTTITRLTVLAEVSQAEADSLRRDRRQIDTLWLRARGRVDTVLDPSSGATIEQVRDACAEALAIRETQITSCEVETNRLRQTIELKDSALAVITFDRDSLRATIDSAVTAPSLPKPTFMSDLKATLKKGATAITWVLSLIAAFWLGGQLL